jgi:hypothetical protein
VLASKKSVMSSGIVSLLHSSVIFVGVPLRLYLVRVSSISVAFTKSVIFLCLLCHASPLYLLPQLLSSTLVFYRFPWPWSFMLRSISVGLGL